MFTGIIQGKAKVYEALYSKEFLKLTLELPIESCKNLQLGASIAVNGTCLTITSFNQQYVSFDVIKETLLVTNLAKIFKNDVVNFERAAKFGDEIGGHLLSGHVHSQISISSIERSENNCSIWFTVEPQWMKYILPKGFVALNGASLTIGEVQDNQFNIHLIPETLSQTTFGQSKLGDKINLEVDPQTQAIITTVERYMANNS